MSPNGEPQIKRKRKRSSPRKDEPRLRVPTEVGSTPGSGWVYEQEKPAPPGAVSTSASVRRQAVQESASPSLLLDVVTLALTTMGRVFLAAASLVGAPLKITRRLFRL